MIRWRVERWRPAQVRSLEVWALPYRGGRLYERLGTPFVEADSPRTDRELALAFAHLAGVMAPEDPLWVAGGLSARSGFRAALAELAMERVQLAAEPIFSGEAGARAELSQRGLHGGLLVDLGQTSVKLSALQGDNARALVPRPLELLPRYFTERLPPPAHVAVEQAARLAELLSNAIASQLAPWPALPPALVLGLPCALDDQGTPGPCTYAGWAGDASWVPRLLARLDHLLPASHGWHGREIQTLLVNDAELAAASARQDPRVSPAKRALVVTLGFGPGAAWLGPEPARG